MLIQTTPSYPARREHTQGIYARNLAFEATWWVPSLVVVATVINIRVHWQATYSFISLNCRKQSSILVPKRISPQSWLYKFYTNNWQGPCTQNTMKPRVRLQLATPYTLYMILERFTGHLHDSLFNPPTNLGQCVTEFCEPICLKACSNSRTKISPIQG